MATKKKDQKIKGGAVSPSREYTIINGVKVDNIAKYKWPPIKDGPGKFQMIHKSRLQVDHTYQRPENRAKALEIAAALSWPAFGVASVAERPDGDYFVFDAQHRVIAAWMRSDVTMVPCMVYQISDISEEALHFLRIQLGRKPLRYIDKHGAKLAAHDPVAQATNDLLAKHGYSFSKNVRPGKFIHCLSKLARLITRDRALVERVFPVVIDAAKGGYIHERMLDGFCYLEKHSGQSLADRKWRDRIRRTTPAEFESAINRAASAYVRGGARRWADGILEVLNKGTRKADRLRLNAPSGEE